MRNGGYYWVDFQGSAEIGHWDETAGTWGFHHVLEGVEDSEVTVLQEDELFPGDDIAALKLEVSESRRLQAELNKVLHPDGGGPAAPSFCDLVAYVRGDLKQREPNQIWSALNALECVRDDRDRGEIFGLLQTLGIVKGMPNERSDSDDTE